MRNRERTIIPMKDGLKEKRKRGRSNPCGKDVSIEFCVFFYPAKNDGDGREETKDLLDDHVEESV